MKKFTVILLLFCSWKIVQSQVWSQKNNFPGFNRSKPVSFSMGGKGYLCAGTSSASTGVLYKDLWEYDPVSDSWIQLANMNNSARVGAVGFSYNNNGFVGLGWNRSVIYKDISKYDRLTNSWSNQTTYPGLGGRNCLHTINGDKLFVYGGADGRASSSSVKGDFWIYDFSLNTWNRVLNPPMGDRATGIAFADSSFVYFGMGTDGVRDFKDIWKYNILTNSWTQDTTFPGVTRINATVNKIGDKVIVGGGFQFGIGQELDDYYELDLKTGNWTSIAGFSNGKRSTSGTFTIGNKSYLFCGIDSSNIVLNDMWEVFYVQTSIKNESENIDFKIGPIPTNDFINIELNNYTGGNLSIINREGKLIKEVLLKQKITRIELGDLSSGAYFYRYSIDGKMLSGKLVLYK